MRQPITSARVENGSVVLMDVGGFSVNRFGSTYIAAGLYEEDLVVVSERGIVEHYKVECGRPIYCSNLGKATYSAVSIHIHNNLNFFLNYANGKTDVYINGRKEYTADTSDIEKLSVTTLTITSKLSNESTTTTNGNRTNNTIDEQSTKQPTCCLQGGFARCVVGWFRKVLTKRHKK